MKKAGYMFGAIGLHTGAAAIVLYLINLAVWSVLAAMLGGALALIGLGLVMWALYPVRGTSRDAVTEDDAMVDGMMPEAA